MKTLHKISWLDSCSMQSRVHLTENGIRTLCGHDIVVNGWMPVILKKKQPKNRHCETCFQGQSSKDFDWHPFIFNSILEMVEFATPETVFEAIDDAEAKAVALYRNKSIEQFVALSFEDDIQKKISLTILRHLYMGLLSRLNGKAEDVIAKVYDTLGINLTIGQPLWHILFLVRGINNFKFAISVKE